MNRSGKVSFIVIGFCLASLLGLLIFGLSKGRDRVAVGPESKKATESEDKTTDQEEIEKSEQEKNQTERDAIEERTLRDQIIAVQDGVAKLKHERSCEDVISNGLKVLENKWTTNDDREFVSKSVAYAYNKLGEIKMTLGFEFEKIGNVKLAEATFKQSDEQFKSAITHNSKYWKPYLNRGIVFAKLGNDEKAVANLRRTIEIRPSQTFGFFNLAEVEFRRKSYVESLANYERVLLSSKDDLQAINGRALCLIKLGRFSEAIKQINKLAEKRQKDPLILSTLADAYVGAGQWKKAYDTYVKALEIEQHPQIYQRLAWLTATCPDEEIRKPQPALFMAEKSISDSRLSTTIQQWETLAAAQALNGNFSTAADSQEQALLIEPENKEALQRKSLYDSKKTFVLKLADSQKESNRVKR